MQLARHFGLPLLAAPVERPDAPASGPTCRGCWPERTANARTAAADPRSCFPTGAHDQHRNSAPACDSWRPLGATHESAPGAVVQCLIRSRHWLHSYDPGPRSAHSPLCRRTRRSPWWLPILWSCPRENARFTGVSTP